jgi:hypothetical protein
MERASEEIKWKHRADVRVQIRKDSQLNAVSEGNVTQAQRKTREKNYSQ